MCERERARKRRERERERETERKREREREGTRKRTRVREIETERERERQRCTWSESVCLRESLGEQLIVNKYSATSGYMYNAFRVKINSSIPVGKLDTEFFSKIIILILYLNLVTPYSCLYVRERERAFMTKFVNTTSSQKSIR